MIKRDFNGTITVSGEDAWSAAARRCVRDKRRLFGQGDFASLYTGIGPNRELLGKQVGRAQARRRSARPCRASRARRHAQRSSPGSIVDADPGRRAARAAASAARTATWRWP